MVNSISKLRANLFVSAPRISRFGALSIMCVGFKSRVRQLLVEVHAFVQEMAHSFVQIL